MMIHNFAALSDQFRLGANAPSAVLEDYISVILKREPEVRAFTCMDLEAARQKAKASDIRWQTGRALSPLDGMPIGVKDIIETAAFPTGQGSPALKGHQTGRDAATVRALTEAGAIVVGKTTTTEFAASELFEPTRNPHDLSRIPGGSSAGSGAACGAGMLPLALGSQVIGSTLRPASYNGVLGYKPSLGALNRGGSFDYLSQSCVGLLGVALEDIWLSARAIASRIGGDPGNVGLLGPDHLPDARKPRRLAVLETDGSAYATPGARAAFEDFLERLRLAGVELVDRRTCELIEELERSIAGALDLTWQILVWEMRWPLNTYNAVDPAGGLSQAMRHRLAQGEAMTQADYGMALAKRQAARSHFQPVASAYDGIITLSTTGAAPASFENTGNPAYNVPASLLGAPALSLPLLKDCGMPLGVQLMTGIGDDAELMNIARWTLENMA